MRGSHEEALATQGKCSVLVLLGFTDACAGELGLSRGERWMVALVQRWNTGSQTGGSVSALGVQHHSCAGRGDLGAALEPRGRAASQASGRSGWNRAKLLKIEGS